MTDRVVAVRSEAWTNYEVRITNDERHLLVIRTSIFALRAHDIGSGAPSIAVYFFFRLLSCLWRFCPAHPFSLAGRLLNLFFILDHGLNLLAMDAGWRLRNGRNE